MGRTVGIDFGTTNSVVVVMEQQEQDKQRRREVEERNEADSLVSYYRCGDEKPPGKRKFKVALKIFFMSFFLLFLTAAGAVALVSANYINDAPELSGDRFWMAATSRVYDNLGNEVAGLYGEQNRDFIEFARIPLHVQQAFIAIEDERFYEHSGVDLHGNIRAIWVNLKERKLAQGASTITQQLVRNVFLTPEREIKRKVQEMWLAVNLEKEYSKEEIFELYLNRIYFGYSAYGVEAAAQTYFSKSVSDLSVSEAALLAGIVRSPNTYNPFADRERSLSQMKTVLNCMLRLEFISPEDYLSAGVPGVEVAGVEVAEPPESNYQFPYFLDYVLHYELVRILSSSMGSRGKAYDLIYSGGLRVYTTLDTDLQTHVESVLARDELYNETRLDDFGVRQPQSAAVLADPVTGEIKALVGGRGYQRTVDENLRYLSTRQPGSAIKPIVVYAPALDEGIIAGAGSVVSDSPFTFKEWSPKNYDGKFRGNVTVREALAYSYNIPAVRIYERLTPMKGSEYAEKMGLSTFTDVDKEILGVALGGVTYGVTALDMAQAYSVLANDGIKVDLYVINRIEDAAGVVIYEHKQEPERILSPEAVFVTNDILSDVARYTTAAGLRIDRPVAAKTGTTDGFRDAYLVAYTPNLVVSFWMGYDIQNMGRIENGWSYTTGFVREIMQKALADLPVEVFPGPGSGLQRLTICTESGDLATEDCVTAGMAKQDWFITRHTPALKLCADHPEVPAEE